MKQTKLNMRDVVILTAEAWRLVAPVTIKNCFKKAGFESVETTVPDDVLAEVEL